MAVVTLRAFGALRELVGARREIDEPDVATLLAALTEEHGEAFTRRLERSSVVVDGEPVDHASTAPLTDGSEVVLLPPFAGG